MTQKKIFICYSHSDEEYVTEFCDNWLSPYKKNKQLDFWMDKDIRAGEDWNKVIEEQLKASCVAIVFVSQMALKSSYIRERELRILVKAAKEERVTLMPFFVGISRVNEDEWAIEYEDDKGGLQKVKLTEFQGLNKPKDEDFLDKKESHIRNKIYYAASQRVAEAIKRIESIQNEIRSKDGRPNWSAWLRTSLKKELGRRYELGQVEAYGEISCIFQAMDRDLDRKVAIKLFNPSLLELQEGLDTKIDEVLRLSANLNHRSIVTIYDVGHRPDVRNRPYIYIIMQHIDGLQLDKLPPYMAFLPIGKAFDILVNLADVLHYLHQKGIVHGRLRPSHIMLDEQGVPVLTQLRRPSDEFERRFYEERALFEKIKYQSPEQFDGKDATDKSDQYALGLLALDMIRGSQKNDEALIKDVVIKKTEFIRNPPSLDRRMAGCPKKLPKVISRMLERDPCKRFSSIFQVKEEFKSVQEQINKNVSQPDWIKTMESYRRCRASHGFIESFYVRFLPELSVEMRSRFSPDMTRQHKILREALDLLLWYPTQKEMIGERLKAIANKHKEYEMREEHNKIFLRCLIETVQKHDPKCKNSADEFESLEMAWRTTLQPGFEIFEEATKSQLVDSKKNIRIRSRR
ncbi:MAG: protein kinase [Nitrospirales bacterium]